MIGALVAQALALVLTFVIIGVWNRASRQR
jgi:hypothetical protein